MGRTDTDQGAWKDHEPLRLLKKTNSSEKLEVQDQLDSIKQFVLPVIFEKVGV